MSEVCKENARLLSRNEKFQMKIKSFILRLVNIIRVSIPAITLFSSAPTFFIFWFSLRLITSIFFSPHIYRRCDDCLYSLYQQFVLFFENWINVKIFFHGDYEQIIKKKENVLYISNHQSSGKNILFSTRSSIVN